MKLSPRKIHRLIVAGAAAFGLLLCQPAFAAFGDVVQTKAANNDGSDPMSVTFDSTPTVGNLIVITSFNFEGAASPNGTLLEAIELLHGTTGDGVGIYYRVVESGDGATWTIDLAGAEQWAVVAREYEGPFEASPLDQTGSASNADVTGLTVTAAGATSQNDELVIAMWGNRVGEAASNVVTGVDNSFTDIANSQNSSGFAWQLAVGTAKKVLSATGTPSVAGTFTAEVDDSSALMATFKKGAGGGSAPTISDATPSGTLATTTTATLGATSDDNTGTFYAVVDDAGGISGITAAQIKLGDDSGDANAIAACNAAVSTTSPSCDVTGLTAATSYSYAAVHTNGTGDSNVVTGTFTTAEEASDSAVPAILHLQRLMNAH